VLIKPQFEAGPGQANKQGVLEEGVARAAADLALAQLEAFKAFA